MRKYAFFLTPFDVTERGRDAAAQNELLIAGVPALTTTFKGEHRPEFRSSIVGALWFTNGEVIAFSRSHSYWSVNSSARLPFKVAKALNDRMGSIVRVDGMSGGTNVQRGGCANWHVDAQEGLNALTQVLKDCFGTLHDSPPSVTELARMGLVNDAIYG
ncbi:hypothetical protein A2348_02965 [Candidatus Uhrbacteria bacterium RIFOXYB12_FULL_58_10]|uniref:Uncharacterized protein n=1 Tax=Candidatus Uhrbacteria bacterium RIFOXYB2_FULL_57_15 TaxID=1802422 RepID=A0A1F7W6N4_9BACT|nr:MAG: hypothetical protein A2348_02965 [Candidatus Uhrbacteria bacterium RIFOXYB12_FULL_58_10]OGL98429.1 MAG: hypothetical protein A2304_01920 [Candidatus Uhrbacteria bacterium RIFOXYB2_FULL_57_15]